MLSPIVYWLPAILTLILVAVIYHEFFLDVFAGFHTLGAKQLREGNYVKLRSGEQGYIVKRGWRTNKIRGLSDNIITIPNWKLAQSVVANYSQRLNQAKEPLRFYTRLPLGELTDFKARNLRELVECLKEVPDSVVYYHTHQFIQEHHYLDHQSPNDFAQWIREVVGEETLGKELASIDTCKFSDIIGVRQEIVEAVEEYLPRCHELHQAPEGREFHFSNLVSFVTPTSYVAHDLREFVEILPEISAESLYFHSFEAKLEPQGGFYDFSTWIRDCLEDWELAAKIACLDPYKYTLETLRATLIQLVESRLEEL